MKQRAEYFRAEIKHLPFKMFTPENATSNCVTALSPVTQGVSAYRIFEVIKDEYGIWVCPNGGELAERVFRVGHIGNITEGEINRLVAAFDDLQKRKLI